MPTGADFDPHLGQAVHLPSSIRLGQANAEIWAFFLHRENRSVPWGSDVLS